MKKTINGCWTSMQRTKIQSQLVKELNWSLEGKVYQIYPKSVLIKAERFLIEIEDTINLVPKTEEKLTVETYYQKFLTNGTTKTYNSKAEM